MLFLMMYVSSFLLVLSCDDWFLIWLGLEVNMISFISLMYNKLDMVSVESSLKYFFIQGLGSAIFMSLFYMNSDLVKLIGSMILTYKMGGGPFFFWFPSICEGIKWILCFMLMTFQKVIPLVIMFYVMSMILWVVIMISMVMGVLGSFSRTNLKQLFAYSSVFHIGWMIMCHYVNYSLWIFYLLVYSLMLMSVICLFIDSEIINVSELMGKSRKWIFVFGMLNMGGMPPMLGFFLKWWVLMNFMMFNKVILFFMIMLSVVMFYIYIRLLYEVVMGYKIEESWMVGSEDYLEMKMDYISFMGILLGLLLGVVIMV